MRQLWVVVWVAVVTGGAASCSFDGGALSAPDGGAFPSLADGSTGPDGRPAPGDGPTAAEQCESNAAFYCVPAPPSGWDGFHYLDRTGAVAATASVTCFDGSTPEQLGEGPVDLPATCSACACGEVQGASCSPPTLTCWEGRDKCNGPNKSDLTAELAVAGCLSQPKTGTTTSCKVTAGTVATGGTCAASTVTATLPAPWAYRDYVCSAPAAAGGCGGDACARRPAGDFSAICIRRDGDVACPSDWGDRHVLYSTAIDTRACTPCSCVAGGASCSGGSYQLYGCTATCGGHCAGGSNPPPLTAGGSCKDVTSTVADATWSSAFTPPTLDPGTCTPQGGTPTGTVTRGGAATYCCR